MENTKKTKVVSMVLNSVMHDARVLKQAESLANNDYDVTVIGIKDNKNNFDLKMLSSSLVVKLVPWKHELHSKAASLVFISMLAMAFVSLCLAVGSFFFFNSLSAESFQMVTLQGVASVVVSILLLLCLAFLTYKIFYARYSEQKKFSFNYGLVENVTNGKSSSFLNNYFEKSKQDKVVSAIVSEAPEILHCHDVHGIKIAEQVKKKCGCKVIFDAHEIYEEVAQGSSSQKKHNYQLQCIAERVSDGFVTINESIADYYKARHPGLPAPVIIKNAVKYRELPPYDGRLHEAAGLDTDRNILLYQGGFAQKRGLFNLLKVAKYLPDNWSLVFMGWGNIKDELLSAMEEEKAEYINKAVARLEQNPMSQKKAQLIEDALRVVNQSVRVKADDNSHLDLDTNTSSSDSEQEESAQGEAIRDQQKKEELSFDNFLDKEMTNEILRKVNNHVNGLMQLEKAVSDNKASGTLFDKIVFVDKAEQSELPLWTSGATIGVIPYENIGLNHYFCTPNKLWEYPVAGVPLLVSPFPEMRKVVEGNDIGWLLPDPINPKEVASFITNLSIETIEEKSNNCLNFIQSDNWEKYSTRLLDLYKSLN